MKGNRVYNVASFSPVQRLEEFTLQHLMRTVLFFGQCFALVPCRGISKDARQLKFEWPSFRALYSVYVVGWHIFQSVVIFLVSIQHIKNVFGYGALVWNVRTIFALYFALRLGIEWPAFMEKWSEMEWLMISYGPLPSLKLRFKIISLVYLAAGLGEHGMYTYVAVKYVLDDLKEGESAYESLFKHMHSAFFQTFEYSFWKTPFLELSMLVSTVVWQYENLLVVLLSCALAERFRQINRKIQKQVLNESQWRDIRKQYNTLCLLNKHLNDTLAGIILTSFLGNIYFLSVNMYQCFGQGISLHRILGVLFYIAHLVAMCIYGGWVHEESLLSIPVVSSLPAKNMSHEVERLLNQMSSRSIVLTGGGMFRLTRSTILNIASVILTLLLIFTEFKADF